MESYLQDNCWVCQKAFTASLKREDHHIIPRAYGGIDGPLVSLCDSHHTAVHDIAGHLYLRKSFNHLLDSDADKNERLLYLATVAYNARVMIEKDPNRQKVIILQNLKGDVHKKLENLKKVYPKFSNSKLIELAITRLYNSHFTE